MNAIYPWNAAIWERLASGRDRLTHGLLLAGPRGLGKFSLALEFARLEVCTSPNGAQPCDSCQSCKLFASGNHPDLHLLVPQAMALELPEREQLFASRYPRDEKKDSNRKPSQQITIHQNRLLIERLATRAHIAPTRVALIAPADAMNLNSSNSLLKLLEEPPPDTRLILVTDKPGALLATIRSRTSLVDFRPPSAADALTWLGEVGVASADVSLLRAAGGGPLAARELAESGAWADRDRVRDELLAVADGRVSAVQAAERWKNTPVPEVLTALLGVLDDLIRNLHTGEAPGQLQAGGRGLDLRKAHDVRGEIARSQATWDASLDSALVLEDAFLRLAALRG